MKGFSECVAFADESGNSSGSGVDPNFPAFVLAMCLFTKEDYIFKAVPQILQLKAKYFGHEAIVLHEREIRKCTGSFGFLTNPVHRDNFMDDISGLIASLDFTIHGCVILKKHVENRQDSPSNRYHIATGLCLSQVKTELVERNVSKGATHILFEGRGKAEDSELRIAFKRATSEYSAESSEPLLDIVVASKRINCTGLQIADLIARPLGQLVLRPNQHNRTRDVILSKIKDMDIIEV